MKFKNKHIEEGTKDRLNLPTSPVSHAQAEPHTETHSPYGRRRVKSELNVAMDLTASPPQQEASSYSHRWYQTSSHKPRTPAHPYNCRLLQPQVADRTEEFNKELQQKTQPMRRTNEQENKSFEIIHSQEQKEKKMNKESLCDYGITLKETISALLESQKRKIRREKQKTYLRNDGCELSKSGEKFRLLSY